MNKAINGRNRNVGGWARLVPMMAVLSLVWTVTPGGAATAAPGATANGAVVRINQVGYPIGTTKRAYLMTTGPASGSTFEVVSSSGAVVYSAAAGASLGVWSNAYPFVFPLDFNGVNLAGAYHIVVSGPFPVTSPDFRIDQARYLYSQPLTNALSFYQNERDGAQYIPSGLRTAPGHLNDANAMAYVTPKVNSNGNFIGDLTSLGFTMDASGGWWDAGDYLKFVETTSFVVAVLGTGVRDFPGQMGIGSTSSNFTAEVKFGTDFIQRMWDDHSRTLFYQVGIGGGNKGGTIKGDHDIWRLPQVDDTYAGTDPTFKYIRNRPVIEAAPPGSLISPNLAGRLAADMGLCFQLFKDSYPSYANQCLLSGEHIFDLADTSPGQLLTAIPYGFYPETEWRDDMELGAAELTKALASGGIPAGLPHTDSRYYLAKAADWANAYITGPNDAKDTLNLYDDSALAHYDLYRDITLAGDPAGLAITKAQLVADLKKQLDGAVAKAAADPFGFGFPWATFDTTSHGAGLAVTASEYAALTGSNAYTTYGNRWLANILGSNAWGVSLIVGDGTTFPNCMQHQVTDLVGSHDGTPPILAGAAVEGPNKFSSYGWVKGMKLCPNNGVDVYAPYNGFSAVFRDRMQSWSTVEPALDLTATSPLAFAWRVFH